MAIINKLHNWWIRKRLYRRTMKLSKWCLKANRDDAMLIVTK